MSEARPYIINTAEGCAKKSHAREAVAARCIDSTGGFASGPGGTVVVMKTNQTKANGGNVAADVAFSLKAQESPQAVAYGGPGGVTVRRLTPVEALRLQGAPDDFLDLDPPLSDAAKYRCAGNGVSRTVAEWVARRVRAVTEGSADGW